MEIRKADSKGRVTVGDDGTVYSVSKSENGTITLHPLEIPDVPDTSGNELRAVYWEPSLRATQADRVYIISSIGNNIVSRAEYIADVANGLNLPVVVRSAGIGAAAVDVLTPIVEQGVLSRQ